MENKIIEYEKINNLDVRKERKIIIKVFFLKLYRDDDNKIKLGFKEFPEFGKLYVNIVHSMYSIYLIEVGVTILLGVLEF